MKIPQFLKRHPQKITGFILVIVGSLQANSTAVQALVTPKTFSWFVIVAGAVVAGLGFLNSALAPKNDTP